VDKIIELRFRDCSHVVTLPPMHNHADNHAQCYVCHPELQQIPIRGACPTCDAAALAREQKPPGRRDTVQ
jgi:hypothetical protein